MQHNTLLDLVREYNETDVGMLSALWIMFGTSGIKEIPPDQLMIDLLRWNGGLASKVGEKSILHTQRTETNSAHYGNCRKGFRPVKIPFDLLRIHHYWSRDEKFFNEVKLPRRDVWGQYRATCEEWLNKWNLPEEADLAEPIQRFVPYLRKQIDLRP